MIVICLIFSAYKTKEPPKTEDKTVEQYLKVLRNKVDVFEVVTTAPNGNYFGRYGQNVVYKNGSDYSLWTCVSSPSGTSWKTVTGGTGSGIGFAYQYVQNEGSTLATESILNFIGSSINCVDNSGSGRTDCTLTSGGTVGGSSPQLLWNNLGTEDGVSGSGVTPDGAVGLGTSSPTTQTKLDVRGPFIIKPANTDFLTFSNVDVGISASTASSDFDFAQSGYPDGASSLSAVTSRTGLSDVSAFVVNNGDGSISTSSSDAGSSADVSVYFDGRGNIQNYNYDTGATTYLGQINGGGGASSSSSSPTSSADLSLSLFDPGSIAHPERTGKANFVNMSSTRRATQFFGIINGDASISGSGATATASSDMSAAFSGKSNLVQLSTDENGNLGLFNSSVAAPSSDLSAATSTADATSSSDMSTAASGVSGEGNIFSVYTGRIGARHWYNAFGFITGDWSFAGSKAASSPTSSSDFSGSATGDIGGGDRGHAVLHAVSATRGELSAFVFADGDYSADTSNPVNSSSIDSEGAGNLIGLRIENSDVNITGPGNFAAGSLTGLSDLVITGRGNFILGGASGGNGSTITGSYSGVLGQSNSVTASNAFVVGKNQTNANANSFEVGFHGSASAAPTLHVGATNVGVGTSAPSKLLDINGQATAAIFSTTNYVTAPIMYITNTNAGGNAGTTICIGSDNRLCKCGSCF